MPSQTVKDEDSDADEVAFLSSIPTPSRSKLPDYLQVLSKSQLAAATHPSTSCLQILAGPGSGKTRVLTSRVAWLVLDHSNQLKPQDILVVTFTNKAANEMKQRLVKLIGKNRVDQLVIGTFHSVCARYLRKFGRLIELPNNFTIIDSDDAKKMIKEIIKELNKEDPESAITFKPEQAMSDISKAKAKEMDPIMYREHAETEAAKGQTSKGFSSNSSANYKFQIATIYAMYQAKLVDSNALDFDDLLVYGVKLFREQSQVVQNIRHVLVDEFQDTNTAQYELMRLVAVSSRAVSIVGDPDQSIYGWRSAEVKNLHKMTEEFKGTQQVRLEENYRSTGSILQLALRVVQQDSARVQKGLYTSHPTGPPVTLKSNATAQLEGAYIASEIKRIVAHSGGMLTFDDFVILLRFNYLSRAIEAELQANGIASRMMGGHKFFDRMEVKDLLAYLALADNPGFTPAFVRVVNVPKRGFGEKGLAEVLRLAGRNNCKPMTFAEDVAYGKVSSGLKASLAKGLKELVDAVLLVRKAAEEGKAVSELLEMLIKQIKYEDYLKSQPDFESRWGNVLELIAFAAGLSQVNAEVPVTQIAVEDVLSRSLATQEDDRQQRGSLTDDDDDSFEEVCISQPSKQISSQSASKLTSSQPRARKVSPSQPTAMKRSPSQSLASKRHVIDLCLSSDEDETRSAAQQQQVTAKRARIFDTARPSVKKEEPAEPKSLPKPDPLDVDTAEDTTTDRPDDSDVDDEVKSPLRIFLEASILATDLDGGDKDDAVKPRVTLSTCHAAKGLEWPVVFIPAAEGGNYPSYRCEQKHEVDEERRLLYVAITRAESLLYISHADERMQGGETHDKSLSSFLLPVASKAHGGTCPPVSSLPFCNTRPDLNAASMAVIGAVTGRVVPSQDQIARSIADWRKKGEREMIRTDELNKGRQTGHSGSSGYSGTGFGSYSSYGSNVHKSGYQGFTNSSAGYDVGANRSYDRFASSMVPELSSQALVSAPYSSFQPASSLSSRGRGGGGRSTPLVPPSRQNTTHVIPNPPSFTDSVRLRARPEDSAGLVRADGTAPRLRADLGSFQQAHSDGMSSFLSLLNPDSTSTTSNATTTAVTGSSEIIRPTKVRRALGMSRRV